MTLPGRYRIVRRLGTGSIGTALGIARPAVTLAIATLTASGCRTIDDPAAYRETPEYEVLLEAAAFQGTTIGGGGETPNAVFAFQWMLAAPSADAAFKDLFERAGMPGKLYALCGLYWTDPSAFAAGVERLKPVKTPVEYLSFGCIGDEITAGELAAREIASGYWPRIFKEYRGKEPPPGELLLLTAALRSRDPEEVADAASSLAWFGPNSKRVLPNLIHILRQGEVRTRREAAVVLAAIGPWARDAVPALREVLDSTDREEAPLAVGLEVLCDTASHALYRIGGVGQAALMEAYEKGGGVLKKVVLTSIPPYDPTPPALLPLLRRIVWEEERADLLEAAVIALRGEKGAIDTLLDALRHPRTEVRRLVVARLEEHSYDARLPEAPFLAALDFGDAEPGFACFRVLAGIGPLKEKAVRFVFRFLRSSDEEVVESASKLLGLLEPEDVEAIPVLIECLDDPAPRIRREAVSSLAVFGSASKSALPAVKKLLHDPDEGVQGDAETTIEVIEGRDG